MYGALCLPPISSISSVQLDPRVTLVTFEHVCSVVGSGGQPGGNLPSNPLSLSPQHVIAGSCCYSLHWFGPAVSVWPSRQTAPVITVCIATLLPESECLSASCCTSCPVRLL